MSLSESAKERRREQREVNKCEIMDFCEKYSIEVEFVTEYHLRLNGRVDLYPTTKKYCLLPWVTGKHGGEYGTYGDLGTLLEYIKTDA